MKWTVTFFDENDNTLKSVPVDCAFAHNAGKVAARAIEFESGKDALTEVVKKTDWIRVSKNGGQ